MRQCSNALRATGVKPRDVVAGFVSNHVEALVAMLAAAALGAIWTGISPDNGVSAVLDRLVQIEPKVLFADNGTIVSNSCSRILPVPAAFRAERLLFKPDS